MLESILSIAKGVSTDSREDQKDKIFFALRGPNFDGNTYAVSALSQGALCAVVDNETVFENAPKQHLSKLYFVDNALVALQEMAHTYRMRFKIPVIAITGTNGKTTTKELIAAALSKKYKVIKTEGNLNNHIGVPLTLLRINKDTDIAIIEMGANKIGDIAELCNIAYPTHGIITNIGVAHLEGFGSKGAIRKTKTELYKFLNGTAKSSPGIVFVNKSDAVLQSAAKKIITSKKAKIISYKNQKLTNKNLLGTFNQHNLDTAYAVASHFKVEEIKIRKALESYRPENMRSQRINSKNKTKNNILLDAYNANPSSMRVAIEAFKEEISLKNSGTKTSWLILGDMKELGTESQKEHMRLMKFISSLKFPAVVLIGKEFSKIKLLIKTKPETNIFFFKTKELFLASKMLENIRNANIFIKGSRGMKMETLVQFL